MVESSQPTVREIAQVMKLSKSTVSAALRNHPDIAEATRLRVQKVARKMGYRKDDRLVELMSYLSKRKRKPAPTPLIWLNDEREADAWLRFPWYRGVYEGARERADELGYKLDQLWCREQGMHPQRIDQILRARGIRGTLLIRPHAKSQLLELSTSLRACAQVLCDPWNQRHHAAVPDGFHNMHLALEQIKQLGYRKPGFIEQDSIRFDTHGAYRAAYLAFIEQDETIREPLPILTYDWGKDGVGNEIIEWVKHHRPDVIICHDRNVMGYLRSAGMDVPGDIGLVHLNLADDVADWSGIDPRHREIGAASVDLVVNQIQNNLRPYSPAPYTIMIKGTWVSGQTTRSPS